MEVLSSIDNNSHAVESKALNHVRVDRRLQLKTTNLNVASAYFIPDIVLNI